jgi:hypothetical protein
MRARGVVPDDLHTSYVMARAESRDSKLPWAVPLAALIAVLVSSALDAISDAPARAPIVVSASQQLSETISRIRDGTYRSCDAMNIKQLTQLVHTAFVITNGDVLLHTMR